ncbi:DUF3987 domain-containing protein [Desulfovibrio cuneatus]|uniref:DUF3987 domain-containing protein n=1 Tax=Desulfovibrio cuneatus TaxID=159728 RepID=UPI00041C4668|nr:DUF3987 domain-containing protein [Desulfovibrio cuneatus]
MTEHNNHNYNYPAPYGAGIQTVSTSGGVPAEQDNIWSYNPPAGSLQFMKDQTHAMNTVANFVNANRRLSAEMRHQVEQQQLYGLQTGMYGQTVYHLGSVSSQITRLPFEGLPSDLWSVLHDLARVTGWPEHVLLKALLGAINTALRGRYQVQIDSTWAEPVLLYIGCFAESGVRKSQVIDLLAAPSKAFQARLQAQYHQESPDLKALQKLGKKVQDRKLNALAKKLALREGEITPDLLAEEIKQICGPLEGKRIQGMPSLFADSFTEKGLVKAMGDCGGGHAIMQAEGTQLLDQLVGSSANLEVFLKAYNTESYSHRSAQGTDIFLEKPFLSIVLLAQPDVAARLYGSKTLVGRGLAARVTPCFLPSGGIAEVVFPGTAFDAGQTYTKKVTRMLERNYTQEATREIFTIGVTESARVVLRGFARELTRQYGAEHLPHSSYLRKLHGAAARFAATLHCYRHDNPEREPMSEQDARMGVAIAKSTISDAQWAFAPNGVRGVEDARTISAWIKRHNREVFEARSIAKDTSVRSIERVHNALDLLESHNHLRQLPRQSGGRACITHPFLSACRM